MPTLYRESNWKIAVYKPDHGIPHFHIEVRTGERCSVSITGLKVITDAVRSSVLKKALVWAGEHQDELTAKWQELNQ